MRIFCHKLLLTFATIHLVLPQSFFFAYQKILMYSLKQARNILGKSEDKNN